jgi:hypothetical protein
VTTACPCVSPSPAERLAALIDGLCKAVAAHGVRGLLTAPLMLLLWSRLRRMEGRARRLASRIAAGAPLSVARRRGLVPRSARSRPYTRLPRGVLWLVKVVPGTASGAASLQFLLADPDMAALAQAPPMRRLLRPLCRMLGVRPPPIVKTPAPPPETAAPLPLPLPRAGDPPHPRHEPRRAGLLAPSPTSPPCAA